MWPKCEVCGKDIYSTRTGTKYCSSTCRSRAKRRRDKSARTARAQTLPLEAGVLMNQLRNKLPKTAGMIEGIILEHGAGCAEAVIKACLVAAGEFGSQIK